VIRARGLERRFGAKRVLRGLDLDVDRGAFVVVTGANGSGKTTLLRILAGLAQPTHGSVTWKEVAVRDLSPEDRADVAYRGHLEALKRDLTVVENLRFHATLWRREPAFDGLLEELKLDKAAHMRARYLSAGQSRRVALAMLKLSGAKLWLLDEPTTNLDSEGRALLVDWTRRHLAAGGLAVVATHQPDDFAMSGALVIEL
jgi:heme exporter protein A